MSKNRLIRLILFLVNTLFSETGWSTKVLEDGHDYRPDVNGLPATAAATTLRKIALPKLTMISFLCSCMATCKMANSEKKPRQTTVTMALMPATMSHARKERTNFS